MAYPLKSSANDQPIEQSRGLEPTTLIKFIHVSPRDAAMTFDQYGARNDQSAARPIGFLNNFQTFGVAAWQIATDRENAMNRNWIGCHKFVDARRLAVTLNSPLSSLGSSVSRSVARVQDWWVFASMDSNNGRTVVW